MQPISKEKFKNLQKGDIIVTDHGSEYEVIRNSVNSPDLTVTTTYANGTGFKPTSYGDDFTLTKIIKNEKNS